MTHHDDDRHGARDVATVLPFLAMALMLPPLVLIFTAPVRLAGVPLIVVYVFGVWVALIAAAYLVARRLKPNADKDDPAFDESGGR
jgi:hypothetical protein